MSGGVALAIICMVAVCHSVCRWGGFVVIRTGHGSARHLRANRWVEILHPAVLPSLGVALLAEMTRVQRTHWSGLAVLAGVAWVFVFATEWLHPAKPCPRCSTGFWSRLRSTLRLWSPSTDPG